VLNELELSPNYRRQAITFLVPKRSIASYPREATRVFPITVPSRVFEGLPARQNQKAAVHLSSAGQHQMQHIKRQRDFRAEFQPN
jgi:hypothetical protein